MQMSRSVRVLTFFQYGFSSRTRKISYAIQGKTTLELSVTWHFINHTIDLFLGFFFQFRHLFLGFLYFSWNLQTQHTRLKNFKIHSNFKNQFEAQRATLPTLLVCLLIFFKVLVIISHTYNLRKEIKESNYLTERDRTRKKERREETEELQKTND